MPTFLKDLWVLLSTDIMVKRYNDDKYWQRIGDFIRIFI